MTKKKRFWTFWNKNILKEAKVRHRPRILEHHPLTGSNTLLRIYLKRWNTLKDNRTKNYFSICFKTN